MRFAARDAEAAEDADRFVQLLPRRVVPEGEVVGEREAAQRLRPFEHAAVRRRAIEGLLEELQSNGSIARREGGRRPSQLVVEHGTGRTGRRWRRRLGRKRVEGGRAEGEEEDGEDE